MARVAKRARIAHDDEPSSRPRDCDAEPPRVAQEADLANIIGTRCRDDDQLGLLRTADAHGSGPIKVTEGHVGPELGAKERAHLNVPVEKTDMGKTRRNTETYRSMQF